MNKEGQRGYVGSVNVSQLLNSRYAIRKYVPMEKAHVEEGYTLLYRRAGIVSEYSKYLKKNSSEVERL